MLLGICCEIPFIYLHDKFNYVYCMYIEKLQLATKLQNVPLTAEWTYVL